MQNTPRGSSGHRLESFATKHMTMPSHFWRHHIIPHHMLVDCQVWCTLSCDVHPFSWTTLATLKGSEVYLYEEKKRAIEFYTQYDMSCAARINELGYPSWVVLLNWYKNYLEHGEIRRINRYCRYLETLERAWRPRGASAAERYRHNQNPAYRLVPSSFCRTREEKGTCVSFAHAETSRAVREAPAYPRSFAANTMRRWRRRRSLSSMRPLVPH
jgi:hypothetical protein